MCAKIKFALYIIQSPGQRNVSRAYLDFVQIANNKAFPVAALCYATALSFRRLEISESYLPYRPSRRRGPSPHRHFALPYGRFPRGILTGRFPPLLITAPVSPRTTFRHLIRAPHSRERISWLASPEGG